MPYEHQKRLVTILCIWLLVQRCSTGLWTDSCTFGHIRRSIQCDFLLFEVAPVFFINKHQVEIVLHAELVVHILVCGCQVIWRQEKPIKAAKAVNSDSYVSCLLTHWHTLPCWRIDQQLRTILAHTNIVWCSKQSIMRVGAAAAKHASQHGDVFNSRTAVPEN